MDNFFKISDHYVQTLNREYVREFLASDPFRTQMTILLGQRGVGKTTAIIQYIAKQFNSKRKTRKALYLPVDHIELGGIKLYDIAKAFNELGGELICFDEIHKYHNWSQELKNIHDTFPGLKVIASGSSALEIHKGSHDLSRRAIVRRLRGLSLREYLKIAHGIELKPLSFNEIVGNYQVLTKEIIQCLQKKNISILTVFDVYLRRGYYPFFLSYKDEDDYYAAVKQTIYTTLENDIPSVHPQVTGGIIKKLRNLLSIIAQQVPFQPTLSKLTSALDIADVRTLKTYFKYLEDASLINTLSKSGKRMAILEKPEKIYLNNTNQSYAIGGEGANIGTVRETFFLNALTEELDVTYPTNGDFNVEGIIFEIGGKSKTFEQVQHLRNAYLALDGIDQGYEHVLPLWLFGMLH